MLHRIEGLAWVVWVAQMPRGYEVRAFDWVTISRALRELNASKQNSRDL